MTTRHHPLPETLISYASGTLPNALTGVVVCHLSMCTQCADDVRRLEMLGGLMLDRVETASDDLVSPDDSVAQWRVVKSDEPQGNMPIEAPEDGLLPVPLARFLGKGSSNLSWSELEDGISLSAVELPKGAGRMSLLRLPPGQSLLDHDPTKQTEIVLVLQGRLSDADVEYVRGDIMDLTEGAARHPVAGGDVDCVCLISASSDGIESTRPWGSVHRLRGIEILQHQRIRDSWSAPAALAACLTIMVGMGLGWLLRGGTEGPAVVLDDLIRTDGNRLIAQGTLQDVLQTLPSGAERAATLGGREVSFGVKMTFQDQAGDYCRQYRIDSDSWQHYSGVACHIGDTWTVKLQALVPQSSGASRQTVPAGGANVAMDAVIGALISGDPLVGQDEADLMKKGWKTQP